MGGVAILLLFFSIVVFLLVQAPPGDFLTSYLASLAKHREPIPPPITEEIVEVAV